MARKRAARNPQPEQLVFPYELRVGDVIVAADVHAEVVAPPKAGPAAKTTKVWLRREGETVQREMVWEAWRKVRVVRRSAA